jgi:hypothetical protein
MSTRLATLALLALVALGLSPALSAQAQCPDPCSASFGVTSLSGSLVPGDTILVTPTLLVHGTGALLGIPGGGTVCHACTVCGARFVLSWNIQSTKDLVYNNCGVLEQDGGSGSIPYGFSKNCGQSINFQLDYGDQSGPGCAGGQPEIPSPNYTAIWTLACTNCQ